MIAITMASHAGNIYKCKDANGSIIFSDTACNSNQNRKQIGEINDTHPKVNPISNAENIERAIEAQRDLRAYKLGISREKLDKWEGYTSPYANRSKDTWHVETEEFQPPSYSYEERKRMADSIIKESTVSGSRFGIAAYANFAQSLHSSIMNCAGPGMKDAKRHYTKALTIMRKAAQYEPGSKTLFDLVTKAKGEKKLGDSYCMIKQETKKPLTFTDGQNDARMGLPPREYGGAYKTGYDTYKTGHGEKAGDFVDGINDARMGIPPRKHSAEYFSGYTSGKSHN